MIRAAIEWPAWRCPEDGERLAAAGTRLECSRGHAYDVHNEIPRFVESSTYADAFGIQWNRYRRTQLDSYTKTSVSADRTRRAMGDRLFSHLAGKHVLECGCGAGRFTEVLLAQDAYVTSVDLSSAVDANQENCPQDSRHRIAQADILRLPFGPGQFDVVFCLGVIQHTPSPERTIAALYEQVAPGGHLVIDHYTHSFSWYTKSTPLLRPLFKRLSPQRGMQWTEKLVDVLLPLHRLVRGFFPAQAILSRISPVRCYYRMYPQLEDRLQREWALVDTHDSLTDWYKHFRTVEQIRRTLIELGAEVVFCQRGGNGVEAVARRPAAVA